MSVKPLKVGQKFYVDNKSINKPKFIKNVSNDTKQNLDVEKLVSMLMNKIDSLNVGSIRDDVYGEHKRFGTQAIDVDIKREIAIGKVDKDAVKSESVKVKNKNNKLDKLRMLRNNNGG